MANDNSGRVVMLADKEAALKAAVPRIVENAGIIAKARKAMFDAYKAEGFTDEQALILCQK